MMLRQIQHFQSIVQENSFTKAAGLCHISQSGISQSVKALEEEIGAVLIIRRNRSFTLTEAGEHFYRKSLVITADLEQLCRETLRIDRKESAVLRLGLLSSYSGDEFNRAISAFSEKYPDVEISVERGARLNDIAPGIIVTPLAIDEFNGPRGDFYKNMFAKCPAGRPGTADEVANIAELLMSDAGAFITGSTFLADGGATASYYYGPLQP